MEIFCSRILHIAENIFEQLDEKSLSNCREVAKSWQNCIDRRNLVWIRIVNVPKILKNGDTYLHIAAKTGQVKVYNSILTGDFFEEWNKITPQIHIRKFEELMAWERLSCWESFLTSTGSALTQRTLWMSEMTPNKTPVLKSLVLQTFWCEFGEWFHSIYQKVTYSDRNNVASKCIFGTSI